MQKQEEHAIVHLHCSTGRGRQSDTTWITTFVKTIHWQGTERRVAYWRGVGLSIEMIFFKIIDGKAKNTNE